MFIVFLGAILVAVLAVRAFMAGNTQEGWFDLHIDLWLWFTVLFANFAEAVAEGRGKAQAESLRKARKSLQAKKIKADGSFEIVGSEAIRKGDIVLVEAGDTIPNDGEVIEGMASVDESAVTGESAPVIRESGGDKSSVTGGTKVLSDWIKVRVTTNPGETFLDRMIGLVEGAKRQKTPNEIALTLLLVGLTIIFLFAVVTLEPFAIYSGTVISSMSPETADRESPPSADCDTRNRPTSRSISPTSIGMLSKLLSTDPATLPVSDISPE